MDAYDTFARADETNALEVLMTHRACAGRQQRCCPARLI
jgi:hypothetical protein